MKIVLLILLTINFNQCFSLKNLPVCKEGVPLTISTESKNGEIFIKSAECDESVSCTDALPKKDHWS